MPRVPILCYHRIEDPPPGRPADGMFVSPRRFSQHVETLARLGFTGVTVRDVVRWQRGDMALPPRPIVLTFDDGYESVLGSAAPILRARGWAATVYVVSGHIGGFNAWDADAPAARLLDANALRALSGEGFEIGSHTRRHRRVTSLPAGQLDDELVGARRDIEDVIGNRVESFAFPYGTHNRSTLERVATAGYESAVTLKRWANGRGANPLRLGRASIAGPLSSVALVAKVLKMMLTPALD